MSEATDRDVSENEARVIEMSSRIYPKLTPIYLAIGLLLLAGAPQYGWFILVPVIVDAIKATLVQRIAMSGYRPELWFALDQYTSVIFIGTAIFFAGGASSPFFPFLAIYAVLFPAVFSGVHLRLGYLVTISTVVAASMGAEQSSEYASLFRVGTILCLVYTLGVFATELMQSDLRYRAASLVDELTKLPNRRAFDIELEAIGGRLSESNESAALVVGDVDHFKKVNDQHGHDVGDQVLIAIANELTNAFRASDVAYRIGGEEFAFVLSGVDPELAAGMADTLRDRIAVSQPGGLQISMSFGVAMHASAESIGTWFRRADSALFAAKRTGRNRVELAASSI